MERVRDEAFEKENKFKFLADWRRERSERMSDEPSDDHFEAAAGVIEAARELDEAREAHMAANEETMRTFEAQRKAGQKLSEAVEKLKGAGTERRSK